MRLSFQLPVHSPLSLRALGTGAAAALLPRGRATAAAADLLREEYGYREVLLTDSGTTALTLALLGASAGNRGCSVALPAYGCYDLATAADGAEVPVVLYDLDPVTLGPDLASLRRALRSGACAVVVAHLYGIPVAVQECIKAAAEEGVLVIEDAAQGSGTRIGGRPAGAWGGVGILSFGRGKGVTGGRGGALLANDPAGERIVAAARSACSPAEVGWGDVAAALSQWVLARPAVYGLPASLPFLRLGETLYHAASPPRALSAGAAGVLSVTGRLAGREARTRRKNAARLLQSIRRTANLSSPEVGADDAAGYLRLPIVAPPTIRDRAETPLARRLGIMPGYPTALCDLPGFGARCLNGEEGFPGARRLSRQLLTLPTHGLLREEDLRALEAWIAGA